MMVKRNWKKAAALAAAALICAGVLSGCGEKEPAGILEEPVTVKNSGRETTLVLGCLDLDGEREKVLEEISGKYEADFANTTVEVRSFGSAEDLKEALRSGAADLGEVCGEDLAGYVREGLLLDFQPYVEGWEESGTLSSGARQALGAMGAGHAFLILNDMEHDLLYYRKDWFDEYNSTVEWADQALCETWDQVIAAAEKLGDRGKLAFGGEEGLTACFDALLWSSVGVEDQGAAYFSTAGEKGTAFTQKQAASAVDQFTSLMGETVLPEALSWDREQALQAFQEGRAGMLLADRSVMASLEETLPEGSWAAAPCPKGLNGMSITSLDSYTGWGISAASEDWETAFHFLTFLSNADNNTHYAKICGTLPIHTVAEDLEGSLGTGPLAAEMDILSKVNQYRYASQPKMYQAWTGWKEKLDEKLRQLLEGGVSPEELLGWMDQYWSDALEAEGDLFSLKEE